MSSIYL